MKVMIWVFESVFGQVNHWVSSRILFTNSPFFTSTILFEINYLFKSHLVSVHHGRLRLLNQGKFWILTFIHKL